MGVFSRLGDIVNSNLNAILDKAEDPAKIIRLVIQEMEDTLVELRTDAARLIAEKKDLNRRAERARKSQGEWIERAELALSKNREDLARAALVEKAKLADELLIIEEEIAHIEESLTQSDADIAKLNTKMAEAKAKQQSLAARQSSATTRLNLRRRGQDGRVDEALMRFEAVERKLDETEAHIQSYEMGKPRTLADEIAALKADEDVDNELKALKERMAGPANS